MVERIYDAAGLPMTDAAAEIAAYLAHRRHKHGSIDHDLRRDFGVDPDALREPSSFYTEHLAGFG